MRGRIVNTKTKIKSLLRIRASTRLCIFLASVILLVSLLFCGRADAQTANKNDPDYISLGMYYFDNWSTQNSLIGRDPWIYRNVAGTVIIDMKSEYKDRKPLLGWYDQADSGIVEKQVDWMIDYGIDFIVFTFYYSYHPTYPYEQRIRPTVGLFKYLESARRSEIDFAILWCDHGSDNLPEDKDAWDRIVTYWLDNFLLRPEYKRIDGKPVIFLWNDFINYKSGINTAVNIGFDSPAAMLNRAKELAAQPKYGLKGLYFVLCINEPTNQVEYDNALSTGFDALTAYNWNPVIPDYQETMDLYKRAWKRILDRPEVANGQIPFFLPLTVGYDNRAWGGNFEAFSTPDQFEQHLIEGRDRILINKKQTKRTAVICAWNEHGEGSVVEPTKKFGFAYLNRIWNVFRNKKQLNAHEGTIIKFPIISSDSFENTGVLIIPANTFNTDVKIDAKQHYDLALANSRVRELRHTNIGVIIDAQGKKPEGEIELRIPYNESDITGINENSLVISRYDEEKKVWIPLKSTVDKENKHIIAYIDKAAIYAIMGTVNTGKSFEDVKYYPNPIQPSKGMNYAKMNFSNMPPGTRVKIYTMLGKLVRELESDASGMAVWDGKNNAGAKAASGVYIVYMEDGSGNEKRIKIAIER